MAFLQHLKCCCSEISRNIALFSDVHTNQNIYQIKNIATCSKNDQVEVESNDKY